MNYKESKCGDYTIREYINGSKHWYLGDIMSRLDGPSMYRFDGSLFWYYEDVLHREDGPAIEYGFGGKAWFIHGELVYTINKFSGELTNHLSDYKGKLSDDFKKSIIKYELQRN